LDPGTLQHKEKHGKANKAARNVFNSPDKEIIPFSSLVNIKRNINKYCIDLWNTKWYTTTENKLSALWNFG